MGLRFNRDDTLDLDRDLIRQHGVADRRAPPIAFLDADLGAELTGQRGCLLVAWALAGEEQRLPASR